LLQLYIEIHSLHAILLNPAVALPHPHRSATGPMQRTLAVISLSSAHRSHLSLIKTDGWVQMVGWCL
jgi:hypothetical protein